jgi:hypothetical protein
MTEHVGRTAKWGTLALVAPMAAGAFAMATAWGKAHQPITAISNGATDGEDDEAPAAAAARGADTAPLDKSLVALQEQARAEQARATRLQRALEHVQARTRALRRSPLPGAGGPAVGGGSTSHTSGTTAVAPPPVVAAPAPAPATHTKTGAS